MVQKRYSDTLFSNRTKVGISICLLLLLLLAGFLVTNVLGEDSNKMINKSPPEITNNNAFYFLPESTSVSVYSSSNAFDIDINKNVVKSETYSHSTINIPFEVILAVIIGIGVIFIVVLFKARYIYFGDTPTVEKKKKSRR